MWKMFSRAMASGSSPEFWDASWDEGGSLLPDRENDRVCENQGVIWRLLTAHLDPQRLFLEGGCGCANWVRYFGRRGYRALGLDFAPRTVERVKQVAPQVDVRVGDVTAMPLEAGSVHSYYSGGVVEHFEDGPEAALREARRVLAPDGWFFCSVPDASTLRRNVVWPAQRLRARAMAPVRKVDATRAEAAPGDHRFFQYLFTPDEFTARLEAAGFTVQNTACYSLLWGLMEVPGLGAAVRTASRARRPVSKGPVRPAEHDQPAPVNGSPQTNGAHRAGVGPALRKALERLLIKEDVGIPVLGPVLSLALEHCANMRLYVARPR